MGPEVQYLILCDDVQADPNQLLRVNVLGLMSRMRSTAAPPFPFQRPTFCVLVILTGCQGTGELSVRIIHRETGQVIFGNVPRPVRFAGSPEDTVGFVFRVRDCSFPTAGLYWVELLFSGAVIARQRLSLTS